jgi:5'-nucleotidase
MLKPQQVIFKTPGSEDHMKQTLTILHTNDLHGHYDYALRQAAFIKKRKQELLSENENVIILDGGDHMDMSMNECLATDGYIHLDLIAAAGYDAMSVGNNELLRLPKDKIRKLSLDSKVPWLLLNLEEADGSQIGGTKETMLLEVGDDLKIGLFGATDQFEDLYENKHGFRNRDTVDAIKRATLKLKEEGANLIIFLSHMGYQADLELAKDLSGLVDVIIGAHSHTVLKEPEVVSEVVIAQAGCYGQFVGELNLTIDTESKKVIQHSGKLSEITLEDKADPELQDVMEKGRKQTEVFLSEILYHTENDIAHDELVKMIAQSLKEYWQSDIGIMYGGAVTSGLKRGDITKGDVLNVCKSMHTPIIMELAGKQIAGLISETYDEQITSKAIYGGGFRPHGIAIGKLQFAGVSWTEQEGSITGILVNGEPIDETKFYTVGTGTPLLYEEVSGYPSVEGANLLKLGKDIMIKDVLIEYVRKQQSMSKIM